MKIWDYIVGANFFHKYAPKVKSYKHKMRGKNGRGNVMDFTEEDVKHIKAGLEKLFKDLMKKK